MRGLSTRMKGSSGMTCSIPDLTNDEIRVTESSRPEEWVQYVSGKTSNANLLEVKENIAFVAEHSWKTLPSGVKVETEVHCQAAVLEDITIAQAKKGVPSARSHYLRADFEPGNLGEFCFPDPLVHVHATTKGEPRFPLSVSPAATCVDFFELLLRNFSRDEWQSWADTVFLRRVQVSIGELRRQDALNLLRNAFRTDDFLFLCSPTVRPCLKSWRGHLRREKKAMCGLIRDSELQVMDY